MSKFLMDEVKIVLFNYFYRDCLSYVDYDVCVGQRYDRSKKRFY